MMRKGSIALAQTLPGKLKYLEAGSRKEALSLLEVHVVDTAVVDLVLGQDDGLDFIKEISCQYQDLKVLVLSMQPEALYAERVLRAGALGMVSKSDDPDTVLEALRTVMRGEFYLSHASNAMVLKKLLGRKMPKGESPVSRLSDRELHVFQMLGSGYSTAEVAENLGLSVKTVETHREKIKRKMNLQDWRELIHTAKAWVSEGALS